MFIYHVCLSIYKYIHIYIYTYVYIRIHVYVQVSFLLCSSLIAFGSLRRWGIRSLF